MTNLLVFFALPIATILLAIVLQKILNSPVLVAITFFAIYLIVAFVAFPDDLAEALIATIIYTILAYITAVLTRFFTILCKKLQNHLNCCCHENDNNDNNVVAPISDNGNLLTISCNCQNGQSNDLLTISSNCGNNDNNGCGCGCGNNDNNGCGCGNNDNNNGCGCNNGNNNTNNGIAVAANIVPTSNNGGRTGSIRGCYRRL